MLRCRKPHRAPDYARFRRPYLRQAGRLAVKYLSLASESNFEICSNSVALIEW